MKTRLILLMLLISSVFYAQDNFEKTFKNDLNTIIEDAGKGFANSRGYLKTSSIYTGNYYIANKSFFNIKSDVSVSYSESKYYPSSGNTTPQQYYFYQGFDSKNPEGVFVFENAERIFDDLATNKNLKKKEEKQERKEKGKKRRIFYSENYRRILELYLDLENKSAAIFVHSDLKPNDLPNYLGCLVLYNIQMNSIASINTYYVYGSQLDSPDILYRKIANQQDATWQRLFSKYEWMPNASDQQVDIKMKSLGVRPSYTYKIDIEARTIQ
jgi:hypothetical protein